MPESPLDDNERSAPLAESAAFKTLSLRAIAGINYGEEIRVRPIMDATQDLFEKTLRLLDQHQAGAQSPASSDAPQSERFIPEHQDLRKRFLYAEAVGGYATLSDLIDSYSPGYRFYEQYDQNGANATLTPATVRTLESYFARLSDALAHAHEYLHEHAAKDFDHAELGELHEIMIRSRERARKVSAILGHHLMREVERAVRMLNAICEKIRTVDQGINGIFLVESEIMFVPATDLIECINNIFKGVGNPYLTSKIDGLLLLAARNLMIEVVAFYCYYGREQIYESYKKSGGRLGKSAISRLIRKEMKTVFDACKEKNKLVLIRVMKGAERNFELSIEAIQREAERAAVQTVQALLPSPLSPPAPKRGWLRSLLARLFGH
ncbi:MAG: hypothetical protein ACREVH_01725 [Gammaproteobacteria bacterium]